MQEGLISPGIRGRRVGYNVSVCILKRRNGFVAENLCLFTSFVLKKKKFPFFMAKSSPFAFPMYNSTFPLTPL